MRVTIHRGALGGEIRAIPSKSDAHRKLICASLADEPTNLMPGASSMDIDATIRCLNALGGEIHKTDRGFMVAPIKTPVSETVLDCGESGSTLRFMLPLASALGADARICASGRLVERPNGPLIEALRKNGASIGGDNPPYSLSGDLRGGTFALPGNMSSQYFSGLLMALPILEKPSEILCTTALESSQYVDLTIGVMKLFNVSVEKIADGFLVPAPRVYHSPGQLEIEGDWSNAAFFFAANAMGSNVRVHGLHEQSLQPDRGITKALNQLGSEIDVSEMPDLAPALAVCAAAYPGVTRIVNASRLRLKESDRISAMAENLQEIGSVVFEHPDGLEIHGGRSLKGGVVKSHNDHRIAMAMAIAGIVSEGPVTIDRAEAVNKSYPNFFDDFSRLGGKVHVE